MTLRIIPGNPCVDSPEDLAALAAAQAAGAIAPGGWADEQKLAMLAALPGLAGFQAEHCASRALPGGFAYSVLNGGGIYSGSAGVDVGPAIVPLINASTWGLAFRMLPAAPADGMYCICGLVDGSGYGPKIGTYKAAGVGGDTHYSINLSNGTAHDIVTTGTWINALVTLMMTADGTTFRAFLNGTQIYSSAMTYFTAAAGTIRIDTNAALYLTDYAYGWGA